MRYIFECFMANPECSFWRCRKSVVFEMFEPCIYVSWLRAMINLHENLHTLRVLCRVLNEVRFNVCQGFEVSVRPAAEVVEFAFSRNNTFWLSLFPQEQQIWRKVTTPLGRHRFEAPKSQCVFTSTMSVDISFGQCVVTISSLHQSMIYHFVNISIFIHDHHVMFSSKINFNLITSDT